ncbi:MAG: EamA/RhaT family transporter [Caulobacteraceae bacterium]
MLWIPITAFAATLQVARNALQRGLVGDAGPWGATLVRFLFGLPFAIAFACAAALLTPGIAPVLTAKFWLFCAIGGGAQVLATAAVLTSMHRAGFALGTVFQQSGVPIGALMGLAFGDFLHPLAWVGLALATAGLFYLSWPRHSPDITRDWTPAILGTVAGAFFALSSNMYRFAGISLDAHHPSFAGPATVVAVQAIQATGLGLYLAVRDRNALVAVVRSWRQSLGAGFFGAAASALWFTAFAMAPAGPVRAVGVVEMPVAAIAGNRFFAERLTVGQWIAGAVTAAGVVMAALF